MGFMEVSYWSRKHGSPYWHVLADSQRNADGLIVCPVDDRVWPTHLESELSWDRIIPGKKGGLYTMNNSQLVCPTCNTVKSDHTMHRARRKARVLRELGTYERTQEHIRKVRGSKSRKERNAKNKLKREKEREKARAEREEAWANGQYFLFP